MKKKIPSIVRSEEIEKIYCNMCGKEIEKATDGLFLDHLSVDKNWGYFSSLDGENHSFDLCEDCYKKMISQFKIPIENE